jgi:hypothetical protein
MGIAARVGALLLYYFFQQLIFFILRQVYFSIIVHDQAEIFFVHFFNMVQVNDITAVRSEERAAVFKIFKIDQLFGDGQYPV